MALKTLQVSSNLARPNSYSFSSCQSSYQPKHPLRQEARISANNHRNSSPVLKCRSNLHDCVDDAVRSQQDKITEIPVVLYPSVVFPGATLQLQTFEFRYRIMMHTLLQEGLRFGIIYSGKENDRMADVGCIVHVVECDRLVDDRYFLTCVSGDRFRIIEVIRTKPYMIARIQVLSDLPNSDKQDDMGCLMQQVEEHLKNVARLSDKLNWRPRDHQAGKLSRMHSPASFSFNVARSFIDNHSEQQELLRLDDTVQRLAQEGRYLEHRSKYLAAITAIKDAFEQLSCNEK